MSRITINVDEAKSLDITATADTTFELDIILIDPVSGTVSIELSATNSEETIQITGTIADTTLSFRGHYSEMVFPTGIYRHVILLTDPVADTRRNLFAGFFTLKPRN